MLHGWFLILLLCVIYWYVWIHWQTSSSFWQAYFKHQGEQKPTKYTKVISYTRIFYTLKCQLFSFFKSPQTNCTKLRFVSGSGNRSYASTYYQFRTRPLAGSACGMVSESVRGTGGGGGIVSVMRSILDRPRIILPLSYTESIALFFLLFISHESFYGRKHFLSNLWPYLLDMTMEHIAKGYCLWLQYM